MDKQPHIPIKNKTDLSPHEGVFQAASEGELGFTSWGGTDHSWHSESYRPMKNAMCKRWDTPRYLPLSVCRSLMQATVFGHVQNPSCCKRTCKALMVTSNRAAILYKFDHRVLSMLSTSARS